MSRESGGSAMEFKYRAVDVEGAPHPPAPPLPQPSSYSYFTEQAIRAGYMAPGIGSMHENFQNPLLAREAIQRELEKERIREEIIASEIARRHALEAEVRREMMLARELALRERGCNAFDRFSFLPGAGMGYESRDLSFRQAEGRSLEERIAMSLEERFGNGTRDEIGGRKVVPFEERRVEPKFGAGHGMIPFQQRAVDPKITQVKLTSDVSEEKEKKKIVLLAKPEPNLSGAKRKSATPPEESTSEHPLIGVSKKKLKQEWSCAICEVSLTSERALNEHIQGKKHKAKEAALRAQRKGKNFGIGIRPNKKEVLKSDSQNQLTNKKFKFWCEMCRVGAYSETVMEAHKMGKKHAMRLQEALKSKTVTTPLTDSTESNTASEPTKNVADEASQNL